MSGQCSIPTQSYDKMAINETSVRDVTDTFGYWVKEAPGTNIGHSSHNVASIPFRNKFITIYCLKIVA
jgi:hypothetical protein